MEKMSAKMFLFWPTSVMSKDVAPGDKTDKFKLLAGHKIHEI